MTLIYTIRTRTAAWRRYRASMHRGSLMAAALRELNAMLRGRP